MQVFLTHLHSDHHADLATLYVGAMFGRKQPWEVWGPSGERPELGTAAAIAGLRQVCGCPPGLAPIMARVLHSGRILAQFIRM